MLRALRLSKGNLPAIAFGDGGSAISLCVLCATFDPGAPGHATAAAARMED